MSFGRNKIRHLLVFLLGFTGPALLMLIHHNNAPAQSSAHSSKQSSTQTLAMRDSPDSVPWMPQNPVILPEADIDYGKGGKSVTLDLPLELATQLQLSKYRDFADYFDNGLLLDFSSENVTLHMVNHQQWQPADSTGDRRFLRRMLRSKASLRLFLPESDGYVACVRLKAGHAGQDIFFAIDENPPVSITTSDTYLHNHWVDLRKSSSGGYHTLHITSKAPYPQIADIRFQAVNRYRPAPDLSIPPPDYTMPHHFISKGSDEFMLPGEGGTVFHLRVPQTSRLLWRLRFERDLPNPAPLTFLIRAVVHGHEPKLLYVRSFQDPADLSEELLAADLTALAGEIVRLEFWTTGGSKADRLVLIDPRLENYMPPADYKSWIPPKNVVIWLSDTLRWDKVRFIKPENNIIQTPNFDRIAREGITFTSAISQGNWSKPSQAGIMSGRYPFDNRMEEPQDQRTADTELIASTIKRVRPEVVTASYSSNGYVSQKFGFGQSWDYMRNMIREGKPNKTEYLFKAMFPVWEQEHVVDKPFFVWFGTIDPHVAYNPRKAFLEIYDAKPYHGFIKPYQTAKILLDIRRKNVTLTPRDWHRLFSLYHGEITYNDHHLGLLMKQLEEWKILDETAIILISDHGEEFLEHGGTGHGGSVYDEQVRVPFIIYYPRGFPRARVVDEAVETMSINPTVLQMFGIVPPKETQAISLIPQAFGLQSLWPRLSVVNMRRTAFMASVDSWRMIVKRRGVKLFDIKTDPYQKNDLTHTRPDVVYYLQTRFSRWKYQYWGSRKGI